MMLTGLRRSNVPLIEARSRLALQHMFNFKHRKGAYVSVSICWSAQLGYNAGLSYNQSVKYIFIFKHMFNHIPIQKST